jgi:class 3 adenylate cyclase
MLVTDLVGSTAIADRIGPVATEALRTEHFGLLREALERGSCGMDGSVACGRRKCAARVA